MADIGTHCSSVIQTKDSVRLIPFVENALHITKMAIWCKVLLLLSIYLLSLAESGFDLCVSFSFVGLIFRLEMLYSRGKQFDRRQT